MNPAPERPAVTAGVAARAATTALVAAPFVWLGAVLAISFLEAPLRFLAPGVTVPLALRIGRLVFPALNALELALGLTITLLLARRRQAVGRRRWALVGGLWAVLLTQAFGLRPLLDARAKAVIAGRPVPDAPWHGVYLGLELVKVVGLLLLGAAVVRLVTTEAGSEGA